jgi:hypothetical protein
VRLDVVVTATPVDLDDLPARYSESATGSLGL